MKSEIKPEFKSEIKSPRYEIRIHGIFESAHYLYDYHGPGENEALHGHTFEAEVFLSSQELHNGISIDFLEIREIFQKLLDELDHKCLNTIKPFNSTNPTSENIARHFYDKLIVHLEKGQYITQVKIWEGPSNYASYIV